MQNSPKEIRQLQSCINDLMSVLSLPAIWTGGDSSQVITTLLDALVGMLRLDFAYARFLRNNKGSETDVLRVAKRQTTNVLPQDVGQALKHCLMDAPPNSPALVANPIGKGEVLVAPFRLGLHDDIGFLVAASKRPDFPTKIEILLLRVAANQAVVGLQEAKLISEHKRSADENLIESERRFRLLVESIPHHVWSFRPDGKIGYWNQRLIDYTGLTPEEIQAGAWAALHPDDVLRVKAAWQEAWANGGDYELERRIRGHDGHYRWVVCRAVAVKNEHGRPVEWLGTGTHL